jgi:hypothetical protein
VSEPFHRRFDIEVGIEEARNRFLQRIRTLTHSVLEKVRSGGNSLDNLFQRLCFELGEHYVFVSSTNTFMKIWDEFVHGEFLKCLRITEAVRSALGDSGYTSHNAREFARDITIALDKSEIELPNVPSGRVSLLNR